MNLSVTLKKGLPPELLVLVDSAASVSVQSNQEIYLVGGAVRDLLLEIPNYDIDLTVNGDAIAVAVKFAAQTGGTLKTHPLFNTATVKTGQWSIDFAMLRAETYEKPGALPKVQPGTLESDLFRRDFTINAMAISLNENDYGDLIDLYGGKADLENKLIRVLHENSFSDDPTRIWRAFRYEQRLGFKLENFTRQLLQRYVSHLPAVGSYRLRHELEMVLREKEPEKVLLRLGAFRALFCIRPGLKADKWVESLFQRLRQASNPGPVPPNAYLALLAYRFTDEELQEFVKYLRLSREQVQIINRTRELSLDLYDPAGTYVELSRLLEFFG